MPKINQMYAFIVEDSGPDDEGIVSSLKKVIKAGYGYPWSELIWPLYAYGVAG